MGEEAREQPRPGQASIITGSGQKVGVGHHRELPQRRASLKQRLRPQRLRLLRPLRNTLCRRPRTRQARYHHAPPVTPTPSGGPGLPFRGSHGP